jgi:NYN domain/OST-HTH/LOTUS domain
LSTPEGTTGQVAVYIDFDNIVMSRYDELHGREAFRNDGASASQPKPLVRQRLTQARIDLAMILGYATSFGTVVVSRAYADWSRPVNRSYAQDTLRHSIDLVQLFPATGTKNGADIRLAIDATDDLAQYSNITHVLVVAGDSDYLALAQRCRRRGRTVIGVGANKSVGRYWESACDEFRFYDALVAVANSTGLTDQDPLEEEQTAPTGSDQPDPSILVTRAMRFMQLGSTTDYLRPAGLKAQMKRLESAFDERALGFKTFGDYLRSIPHVLRLETDQSGGRVYPVDPPPPGVAGAPPAETAGAGAVKIDPAEKPLAAAGRSEPPSGVAQIRRELNLPQTTMIGVHAEECAAVALRAVWSGADRESSSASTPPARRLAAALTVAGLAEQAARQFGNVLMLTMPLWLRDDEMTFYPNPELVELSDEELREIFHVTLAARVKHRLHPQTTTVDELVTALYGSEVVAEDIRSHLETGLSRPGFEAIRYALDPLIIPPPVLWDVAEAFLTIPSGTPMTRVDELVTAFAEPFRQLERDPETVPMQAVHETLVEANLLQRNDSTLVKGGDGLGVASEVISAILLAWARRCARAGIRLSSTDTVAMDALYRLILPDPYQGEWREWLREAIESQPFVTQVA